MVLKQRLQMNHSSEVLAPPSKKQLILAEDQRTLLGCWDLGMGFEGERLRSW